MLELMSGLFWFELNLLYLICILYRKMDNCPLCFLSYVGVVCFSTISDILKYATLNMISGFIVIWLSSLVYVEALLTNQDGQLFYLFYFVVYLCVLYFISSRLFWYKLLCRILVQVCLIMFNMILSACEDCSSGFLVFALSVGHFLCIESEFSSPLAKFRCDKALVFINNII